MNENRNKICNKKKTPPAVNEIGTDTKNYVHTYVCISNKGFKINISNCIGILEIKWTMFKGLSKLY